MDGDKLIPDDRNQLHCKRTFYLSSPQASFQMLDEYFIYSWFIQFLFILIYTDPNLGGETFD